MDLESTMQFIVNQQAQFVADIHMLQERQRELQESQKELGVKVDKLHEVVMQHDDYHIVTNAMVSRLAEHLEDFVERQGWLFDGHKLLLEAQRHTESKLEKLADAQLGTEAKVDKLADKFDRFIDEVRKNVSGGNGKKSGGNGGKTGGKNKT